jgi:hypothetical protein
MLYRTELPEGDYTLTGGSAWITVGKFSVWLRKTDDGVLVEIYEAGAECDDAFAEASAFNYQLEDDTPL